MVTKSDPLSYEAVSKACSTLVATGVKPSVRSVTELVGGSNTTVLKHLRRWTAEQDTKAGQRPELPLDVRDSISAALARADAAARAETRQVLETAQSNLDALVRENERLEARHTELADEASSLKSQLDTLSGRAAEQEKELDLAKQSAARDRDAAEQARASTSNLALKLSASESALAESRKREAEARSLLTATQTQLDAVREAAAKSAQQASAAGAQLESERAAREADRRRALDIEAALSAARDQALRLAGAEASVAVLRETVEWQKSMLNLVTAEDGALLKLMINKAQPDDAAAPKADPAASDPKAPPPRRRG